jgi:hypothetical protein
VKGILKYSPSFTATLSLVHTLFKWRYSEGAREKARRYLLRFAAPSPLEISGLRRQYRVQEKDGLVFAVTRPFLDKKGNEVSSQYTVLSPDSEITRKIITDGHQHGEGMIFAYSRILTQGYLVIRGKVLLKRTLNSCVGCLKIKLIPSQASLGRDETELHANSLPMQICYVDIAGHWMLPVIKGSKTKVKAWIILLTCSWSRFVKIQPLERIDADSVLTGLTVALGQYWV